MRLRVLAAIAAFASVTAVHAQTPAAPSMPGYPAIGGKPIITVIAPGENPKPMIHPAPAAGLKEHMEMTMTMSLGMEIAGMSAPSVNMPPIIMGMDLGVTNVAANGDMSLTIAFSDVKLGGESTEPSADQMIRGLSSQMKDFKGTMVVAADGHVVSQDINVPSSPMMGGDATKSFIDSIRDMTPPLPSVPMGVGGKWEARIALQSSGATVFQKMAYEVVSIDSASMTLKMTHEQTFPPQAIVNPQLPPGAEMALESGTGSGSGTITLRTDSLVPSTDLASKTALRFRVSMSGESQPMTINSELKLKIRKN